jgi:hypothetical protein
MNRGTEEREKLAAAVEKDCCAAASVGRLRRASLFRDDIVKVDVSY